MEETCGKRYDILISYIHQIADYEQYCQNGIEASECKFNKFQDAGIARNLAYSTSTSVFMLRGGSCTIVPMFSTRLLFLKQEILITTTQRPAPQHDIIADLI